MSSFSPSRMQDDISMSGNAAAAAAATSQPGVSLFNMNKESASFGFGVY